MQRIRIADGIHFNMLPETKFKTNFFQVSFVTDLERQNTTNMSLLTGVLFKASEKQPDVAAINNRLDYLYDTNASCYTYKRGERIVFCYESDFIKNDYVPAGSENLLVEAIDMFRQLIFRPRLIDGGFDKEILDLEKSQLEKDIKSIINNKNSYAKKKCTEGMCEGEKYSIEVDGELEDIPSVTEKSLYEFYLNFLKTAQIEIFFNGEGDETVIAEEFRKVFDLIPERAPKELCDTFVSGNVKEKTLEITEQMPVSQGKLAIGFRTGVSVNDEDSTAMTLFNEIFGGSPVSKLFMNVREKLSLCYYCKSVPDAFKGVMFVLSGIESENRDKSLEAILKELKDVQDGKVSAEELEAAKLSILNGYKTIDDNPATLCNWYLARIICGNFLTPEDVAKKIENTTLEQVVTVSKKVKLDTVYFLKGTSSDGEAEEE